jgi:uncharacterized protein (DUF362 family)
MIDRRTFIRFSLSAAAAAAFGGIPVLRIITPEAEAASGPPLAVRKGKDISAAVREAVASLGGMSSFVKKGETVVLKPNIGWDRAVEFGANTHPLVVTTVAELCLEAGADKITVFDRSCNDPRRCYVESGIQDAIEGMKNKKVVIEHIDRRAFSDIDIDNGKELARWSFYKPAIEADRLINIPVAKHHGISKVTLGMKNMMGVIGGNRGRLHRNISESLADINSVIHSDLTIIDATRVLTANGPVGGRLEDVKVMDTIIASPDIVAADAYAATLFGHKPEDIESITAGAGRGLGIMDLNRIRMV